MDARWTTEEIAFQQDVRAFLAENLTPEIRRAGDLLTSVYADPTLSRAWQKILARKGWAAPSWPVEYGGCDWTPMQHLIFARERIAAGAPPLSPMGINMVAHVIMRFGTPAQKAYFLPKTLTGDIFWCQGYSEPNAGSDLASLQMSAIDKGDHFLCNGSKIWTTFAHVSDWCFCLVRTSTESTPQQGITFLLIDMTSPGVEVRPLVMLSGEHIQNQIFFTDVRVPKENVLGQVGMGWHVAKSLLEFERGGSVGSPILQHMHAQLAAAARRAPTGEGGTLRDDEDFAARLTDAKIRIDAFEALELRLLTESRKNMGGAPSMVKVIFTELSQHLTELALEAAAFTANRFEPHAAKPGGPVPDHKPPPGNFAAGDPWQSIAPLKYLNDRAATIYGGSNEIQRNIMTKMFLGL